MKRIISILFFSGALISYGQNLSEEDRKLIIQQLKQEILDSLKAQDIGPATSTDSILLLRTKQKGEPLEGMDFTWANGSDRRTENIWTNNPYFAPSLLIDVNYNYSFNNPIDNTVVGSTAIARHNEIQLAALHFGGDFTYKNARARFMTQFGTRSVLVPRNDYSPYKGQYQLWNVYRHLSEAYVGYHFNKWYGINIDAGMFMSYIGLNSYYQAENWEYQASFTSDNTPWFFNGIRLQMFPTKKLKVEAWLINGWQSYGKFNTMPGAGFNITYSPNEKIKLITNNYFGADAAMIKNRFRFHSDNSFLLNYYNKPTSKGITKMAFSLTSDLGFEKGGGVNGFNNSDQNNPAQYFASVMFYNRMWFAKNKMAWTIGGGWITNPGRYLVLYPTGEASPLPDPNNPTQTEGAYPFSANPGDQFVGYDFSTNLDFMPNQSITFRLELVHRNSSVPYFAGRGGVTSPSGYTTTTLDPAWRPDLVKSETRIIFAILFRL
ncbi:MAG: outer membrane beta-barrel protein [Bacteroidota bacterium]